MPDRLRLRRGHRIRPFEANSNRGGRDQVALLTYPVKPSTPSGTQFTDDQVAPTQDTENEIINDGIVLIGGEIRWE